MKTGERAKRPNGRRGKGGPREATTAVSVPAPTDVPPEALAERIRRRAFEIYQARRGGPGDAMSDWLQAEREILGAGGRLPVSQVEPRHVTPTSAIRIPTPGGPLPDKRG